MQSKGGDEPIQFKGECRECERIVRRYFPPRSQFLQMTEQRLLCLECDRPVLCEKVTA